MHEGRTYFKDGETKEKVVSLWIELCKGSRNEEQVLKWIARPPLFTALRVNTLLLSREKLAEKLRAELEDVFHTRNYKPPNVYPHKLLEDVLIVESQRDSCYIPQTKSAYAVVGVRCGEAALRGAHVYAPGVLSVSGDVGEVVSVYADIEGKCLRGLRKPFQGSLAFVGNGILLMDRNSIFSESEPRGVAVRMDDPLFDNPPLRDLLSGLSYPQNLPSIVVGHVLQPKAGDTILDLCAGVGGKSTHVAQLMENKGSVICIDKSKGKLRTLEENVKKMGISVIKSFRWDSTRLVDKNGKPAESVKLLQPPFPTAIFDSVLADVPCSGLGQRPTLYIDDSVAGLGSYVSLQRRICCEAVQLVKPGGVLIYSTCTILPEENEQQIQWILTKFPEFKLESPGISLGSEGLGYGLGLEDRRKVLRFGGPSSTCDIDHDSIGFFIAKLRKSS